MDNFYSAESSISSEDENEYDNAVDDMEEDDENDLYSCNY